MALFGDTVNTDWLLVISATVNFIGLADWLFRSIGSKKYGFAWKRFGESDQVLEDDCSDTPASDTRIRLIDLALTQGLGWYSLCVLLGEPLLRYSYVTPPPEVLRYVTPVLLIYIGRHVYLTVRYAILHHRLLPALCQSVFVVCYLLLLLSEANTIVAVAGIAAELGSLYTASVKIVGEEQAYKIRVAYSAFGVAFTVIFRVLLILTVLAVSVCVRSPLVMRNYEVALFFFFLGVSLLVSIYDIYQAMKALNQTILARRLQSITARCLAPCHNLPQVSVDAALPYYLKQDCHSNISNAFQYNFSNGKWINKNPIKTLINHHN